MGKDSKSALWMIYGFGVLTAALAWTWLSGQFHYGESHAERPILLFVSFFALAWLAFGLAGRRQWMRSDGSVGWILAVALAARLLLLPSGLIQENDVYRYVLDGQAVLHGVNPFAHAPLVVSEYAPQPLRDSLAQEDARLVLSRIGYPQIPTVYPPVAQGAFALGAFLSGWDWMGQRWVLAGAELAVLGLLALLCRWLALPAAALVLWAWNPLVLKEVVNSAHVDVLVSLFLLGMVAALIQARGRRQNLWTALAGAALGLAILSKIYPLILLPAVLLFLWRREEGRSGIRSCLLFLAPLGMVLAAAVAPFLGVGIDQLTRGLDAYARQWKMNAGAFLLLEALLPSPRLLSAGLLASAAVLVPACRGSRSTASFIEDLQWVLLLWFLLLPAPFPWYALGLAALLPLGRPFSAPSLATLVLCGVSGAYYLSFYFEYRQYPSVWWTLTQALEHAVIWAVVLFQVLRGRLTARLTSPFVSGHATTS